MARSNRQSIANSVVNDCKTKHHLLKYLAKQICKELKESTKHQANGIFSCKDPKYLKRFKWINLQNDSAYVTHIMEPIARNNR